MPFKLTQEYDSAFNLLKEILCSYPILRNPDFSRPFILYTDASHIALGAVLSQIDDHGQEYVVAYASKLLKEAERNYNIAELECLAVVWAINHFRVYLYSSKFTVYTDNIALKWLLTLKSPSSRLTRWSIALSTFRFDIKHRPVKSNGNADALSRPVLHASDENDEQQLSKDLTNQTRDPYNDLVLLQYLQNHFHIPGTSKNKRKRAKKQSKN